MTKADIVNSISQKTGIDKPTVLNIVEAFAMTSVKESLANEENVYLRGFGSFIFEKSVPRKQPAIFQRIQPSSSLNTTSLHSSLPRLLCTKSNKHTIHIYNCLKT